MTKRRVTNVAASVRQQLQNVARASARPFQEVLQYFAMERFLYRLAQSPHANKFVLKGALMFTAWRAPATRPTRDIDLLGQMESSVEVGFGDVIVPGPQMTEYPTILDHARPLLAGYSRETCVAEKFEAMVKLGILNSRMKDFYDVWLLSRQFDFDGTTLASALEKTFAKRGTPVTSEATAFLAGFASEPAKITQWQAFLRKSRLEDAPNDLASIVEAIVAFLAPPASAISEGRTFEASWVAPGPWATR